MLRQTLQARRSVPLRRWLNAAATSKQKRALNKEQLQGTKAAATKASDPASPQPPSSPPPPSDGGTNNLMLPLGLGGLAVAGGLAYYLSSTAEPAVQETTPALIDVKTKESTKKQNEGKPTKKAVASASSSKRENENETPEHRVSVIEFPPGMRNTGAAAVNDTVPAPHPEGGNRVRGIGVARTPTKVEDASMTAKAIAKLQSEQNEQASRALVESHQSAWTDATNFNDLDSLSETQLKARIVQLATEIKDRTKWEAVRLKEFLAMKEKETADKYLEILQKQRLEFEDLLAKRLREQEHAHADKMRAAMQEKDASIQNVLEQALAVQKEEHEADLKAFEEITTAEIKGQLDRDYGAKMTEYTEQVAAELQTKAATLQALQDKLAHLEAALSASQTAKEGSVRAHRLSAAALALAEKLETSQPAASEVQALKLAAGEADGVISTALGTIPEAVQSGVPTLAELQTRFDQVHKKCRQAALVPAGRPGLEGQLAGMLFATVKYAPSPDEPAPEAEKDSAEYVLVRAKKYVQLGDLEQAVEQLDKLEGQAAFTVADWKRDAMSRVAVVKALKVIKMECALLNESLAA